MYLTTKRRLFLLFVFIYTHERVGHIVLISYIIYLEAFCSRDIRTKMAGESLIPLPVTNDRDKHNGSIGPCKINE